MPRSAVTVDSIGFRDFIHAFFSECDRVEIVDGVLHVETTSQPLLRAIAHVAPMIERKCFEHDLAVEFSYLDED